MNASSHLVRAVHGALLHKKLSESEVEEAFGSFYPGDVVSKVLFRAAVSPASLGPTAVNNPFAAKAVSDFIGGLGPSSAAAQLIAMSLAISRPGGFVTVPGFAGSMGAAVAEGAPIPVYSPAFSSVTLSGYHEIAGIVAFSKELIRSSAAEAVIETVMSESLGYAIDIRMLSTAAASETSDAGLRNGATVITATGGGDIEAMHADLLELASAVAPVAGGNIVFIASPRAALKIALRLASPFPYPVLASAALPEGTVMAVAVKALATMISPLPAFDLSTSAVLHFENTTPLPISASGTVADPVRSLWQMDCVAIRVILGMSWGMRVPNAVAVINSVSW